MGIKYHSFAKKVISSQRFIHDDEVSEFLERLKRQLSLHIINIHPDVALWRAQIGYDLREQEVEEGNFQKVASPYEKKRMVPDPQKVTEGRANPSGIAVLYLASSPKTAMHEMRPWIGATLSVGWFKPVRELKVIDLASFHGRSTSDVSDRCLDSLGMHRPPKTEDRINEGLMIAINNAFSQPVSSNDDKIQYVPTQIIAELVKQEYDGIRYKSNFAGGYNVALFDRYAADMKHCCLCHVTGVKIDVSDPYDYDGSHNCPRIYREAWEDITTDSPCNDRLGNEIAGEKGEFPGEH